jgi:hypothetical protein
MSFRRARPLWLCASLLGCAAQHGPAGARAPGASVSLEDESEVADNPELHDAGSDIDAARCDDHGAIVDPLVLSATVVAEDRCTLRMERWHDGYDPDRLDVSINLRSLRPDAMPGSDPRDPGYVLDGDVIRFTGAACDLILSRESPLIAIRLRYGPCRNWE